MTCKKRAARGWRRPLPAGSISRAIRRPCRRPVEPEGPRAGRSASWPYRSVVLWLYRSVVPLGGTTSGLWWAGLIPASLRASSDRPCTRRSPLGPGGSAWSRRSLRPPSPSPSPSGRPRTGDRSGASGPSGSQRIVLESGDRSGPGGSCGRWGPSGPRRIVRALGDRPGPGGSSGHRETVRAPADRPGVRGLSGPRRIVRAQGDPRRTGGVFGHQGFVWAATTHESAGDGRPQPPAGLFLQVTLVPQPTTGPAAADETHAHPHPGSLDPALASPSRSHPQPRSPLPTLAPPQPHPNPARASQPRPTPLAPPNPAQPRSRLPTPPNPAPTPTPQLTKLVIEH
ncbi:hypothetical protein EES41_21565 [Streptomyces sp. ADI95-16]|nr:hypothetical protein EES41_21565 [Streptomyces sp. ADI95-16]